MSICHDKKLIFVHIPKNAGTSIHSYFNSSMENILSDQTWKEYSSFFNNEWEDYTKFTIVRDPYCRFRSFYKYLKIGKDINYFAKIVKEKKEQLPITRPQYHYICHNDDILVDKIIRQEDLNSGLESIGIKNFPQKNKSKDVPEERLIMNEDTIATIHSIYEKDFKILGYDTIS